MFACTLQRVVKISIIIFFLQFITLPKTARESNSDVKLGVIVLVLQLALDYTMATPQSQAIQISTCLMKVK